MCRKTMKLIRCSLAAALSRDDVPIFVAALCRVDRLADTELLAGRKVDGRRFTEKEIS